MERWNRLLSQMTLVTSIGDFVSLFAVLVLLKTVTGSVAIAAYGVPIKSLGVAMGGATFPWVMSRVSIRKILAGSQLISGILMLGLAAYGPFAHSPFGIFAILFFQTILKQYFEGARETFSKSLGGIQEQRPLQAQILQGLYSAQVVGPLLSIALLKLFPVTVPILVDAASFLIAAAFCLRLPDWQPEEKHFSVRRPLTYLAQKPGLALIFWIRSAGYWIPVGLYNYLLFSVVYDHYHLAILDSAWTYAAIGLGSWVATTTLRATRSSARSSGHLVSRIRMCLVHRTDGEIACIALLLLAGTRIAFITLPMFVAALGILLVSGICNGLNAVATQSLRRKLTTDREFPEIVGLEVVVGRVSEWLVSSLALLAVTRFALTYQTGILLSASLLVVLAPLHLSRRLAV